MSGQKKEEGCVFCNRLECNDREHYVLHRGKYWYLIRNLYPYNSGHILLILNRHHPRMGDLEPQEVEEMGRLLQAMEETLTRSLHPDGITRPSLPTQKSTTCQCSMWFIPISMRYALSWGRNSSSGLFGTQF